MIVTLAARGAQILFGLVVLILSIVLIKDHGPGKNPSIIPYGTFCGGAGLLIAIVGVVAIFFEALQGIVVLALDGLATFFLLAGGLAFAIQTKVGDCNSEAYLADHVKLFTPSVEKNFGDKLPGSKGWNNDFLNDTKSRCRMIQAETAMVWLMFGTFLVTVALGFMNKTSKRGGEIV